MVLLGAAIVAFAFMMIIFNLLDKKYKQVIIYSFIFLIGVFLMAEDLTSPVKVTLAETYTSSKLNNIHFSSAVQIKRYKRDATNFAAIAKDDDNFKYEIQIQK